MRKLRLFPVPRSRQSSRPPSPTSTPTEAPDQHQEHTSPGEPSSGPPPEPSSASTRPVESSQTTEKAAMADTAVASSSRSRGHPSSKAELAKRKIETLFQILSVERDAAKKRSMDLEEKLASMVIGDSEKEQMRKKHVKQEIAFLRERRRPMSEADFEMISIIGKGAFGEVMLVKHKKDNNYYAMKKLRKKDMLKKEQVNHAWSERHVLVAANHEFVCQLCYAFQNSEFLYLVMEFLAGGDLMTLLIDRDTLTEEDARFYIAEMVVAIDTIHKLGFIHRDVKPDNLLIDKDGHLKLSDFGLCKSFNVDVESLPASNVNPTAQESHSTLSELSMAERAAAWRRSARKQAFSTVGTPDYISCEVLMKRGYNKECDYWSLGVVLYEMLVGYPPFYAEGAIKTCRKILNWRQTLRFPPEAKISWAAKNLIQSLVCDAKYRLGAKRGMEDFKEHPFFEGVDWENLRTMKPPFMPELRGPTDTRYFEDHKPLHGVKPEQDATKPSYLKDPAAEEFIGFTFKRYNPNEAPAGRRAALTSSMYDVPDGAQD